MLIDVIWNICFDNSYPSNIAMVLPCYDIFMFSILMLWHSSELDMGVFNCGDDMSVGVFRRESSSISSSIPYRTTFTSMEYSFLKVVSSYIVILFWSAIEYWFWAFKFKVQQPSRFSLFTYILNPWFKFRL